VHAPSRQVLGNRSAISADLKGNSGGPISGVEICFSIEDGAASIDDPTDGCGTTDSGGHVSGAMTPTSPGSFQFTAEAPSNFGLSTSIGLRFDKCTADSQCTSPNTTCDLGSGFCFS
jgi:hypothetical protein